MTIYLEHHRVRFSPDGQRESSDHAAAEAEEHRVVRLHLDGHKDGHEPRRSKTAPENGCVVSAIGLGKMKLALNSEGGNIEPEADLHANVKHVDETDENNKHPP